MIIGNYSETVNDAKAAIELQPHFLKAFVRGKSSNSARNQVDEESLSGCATSKSLFIYFILFYFIYFILFYFLFFIYLRVTVVCLYGTRKRLIQTLMPCGFAPHNIFAL